MPSKIRMGYPRVPPSKTGWGTPISRMGYPPPIQTWNWGYPGVPSCPRLDGVPPCPRLDRVTPSPSKTGWGNPPPPSAKRALVTRRAVCLLRSRRRTLSFHSFLLHLMYFWIRSRDSSGPNYIFHLKCIIYEKKLLTS